MVEGRVLSLVLVALWGASVHAEDLATADFGIDGGYDSKPVYSFWMGMTYASPPLDLAANLSVHSDRKYGPEISNWNGTLKHSIDNWFRLEEGYTTLHLPHLDFRVGRFAQKDTFRSPYSLFLSSEEHPLLSMTLSFHRGPLGYESRWIELNHRSRLGEPEQIPSAWRTRGGYPDRGANLRTWTWRVGDTLWGLQDVSVYTERSFDLEHFVSPMPAYLTQYVKGTDGRPWSNGSNENNIIGAFVVWETSEARLGAQFLMDDFSTYFLVPDQSPDNPWKVAMTAGGELTTPLGRWGAHLAGATQYTFGPITTKLNREARTSYGYTLYPDVEYYDDYQFRPIAIVDNLLGYKHGENNAAFMVTYETPDWQGPKGQSSIEFVLAGSNSPANPWHDDTKGNPLGTRWLEGPLQQSLAWKTQWTYPVGGGWNVTLASNVEMLWHSLQLEAPLGVTDTDSLVDRYVAIFRPSDDNQIQAMLLLGVTWQGTAYLP